MHERPQLNLAARLPWTVSVVAILILGAISTRTYIEPLGEEWYESWGSSPAYLMKGDLQRLFSSPVLTPGQSRFYISLFMAAICVGAAEWLEGTFKPLISGVKPLSVHFHKWLESGSSNFQYTFTSGLTVAKATFNPRSNHLHFRSILLTS